MSSASHKIYDQAAAWAVKRDLRPLSAKEQEEFSAWLAADIRHVGAYGRAEAALMRLERLTGVATEEEVIDRIVRTVWNRRSALLAGGAVAAGFAVMAINRTTSETLTTKIGELREDILPDGSVVSLNTNSEISLNFSEHARYLTLARGEALFDVAKDRRRPFIVAAGGAEVRAVGTSFAVSLLPQKPVQIFVKEGVVEVKRSGSPRARSVRAVANVRAIVAPDAPIVVVPVQKAEVDRNLEWQNGRISLENETLSNAAAEFARYSDIRIVVDHDVEGRTVTGLFASHDPVGFAKNAALLLKLQTEVKGDQVRIFSD